MASINVSPNNSFNSSLDMFVAPKKWDAFNVLDKVEYEKDNNLYNKTSSDVYDNTVIEKYNDYNKKYKNSNMNNYDNNNYSDNNDCNNDNLYCNQSVNNAKNTNNYLNGKINYERDIIDEFNYDRFQIKIPGELKFCPMMQRASLNSYSRIGSDSNEGEVYKVKILGKLAALKLMPILSDKDNSKNENEIDIAKKASELVMNGQSQYFPILHGSGKCMNASFFHNGRLGPLARNYAGISSLIVEKPEMRNNIRRLARNHNFDQILQELNIPKYNPNITAYFMLSELADEDLLNWTKREHSAYEWSTMLLTILDAIDDLHNLLSVSHSDLH